MNRPLILLLILGLILTACAPTNAPAPTMTGIPETFPTETIPAPTISADTPSPALAATAPQPDASPTANPPTALPATVTQNPNVPNFASVLSGGNEGSLYPAQDISIIARTGHLQFLNVYANW